MAQDVRLGLVTVLASAALSLLPSGCSREGDGASAGDEQNIEAASQSACTSLIEDRSGEGRSPQSIAEGDDAVAQLVFQRSTTSCPVTLRAVVDKLREQGCGKEGMKADFVSERSVLIGKPEGGRAVLFPECPDRAPEELVIAPPTTLHTTGPLTASAEIIAMTKAGTFNFYAVEGGKWQFFGDSRAMLKGPGPKAERKCASCHTSGGLIMKELRDPWTNWDSRNNSGQLFGIEQLRANLAWNLGIEGKVSEFSAPFMSRMFQLEVTVRAGNAKWNGKRVEHLIASGSVADLVKPIFCTQEINLEYGRSSFRRDDPRADELAYAGAIRKAGQQMRDDKGQVLVGFVHDPRTGVYTDTAGNPLVDAAGEPFTLTEEGVLLDTAGKKVSDRKVATRPLVDTPVEFVHIEPAAIDTQYIEALVAQNLVSRNFVVAAAGVDLGRSVLSDARCSLLGSVPKIDIQPTDTLAARLDDAMKKALAAKTNRTAAENELARNLDSPAETDARAGRFFAKCDERRGTAGEPLEDVILDFLRAASQDRKRLRKLPIAEHGELLPFDTLNVSDLARWDPATCKLSR
jgi:hypothetical protein